MTRSARGLRDGRDLVIVLGLVLVVLGHAPRGLVAPLVSALFECGSRWSRLRRSCYYGVRQQEKRGDVSKAFMTTDRMARVLSRR